ncbi:hypothetical protein PV05_05763 [Exophiala xenobiotica]|uniref:F-box domain-containing protein n=1 Tax=Exophiala xenobiotica TaxID=348802 RepID=A0A0D2D484_9EURO|nr:uncharacterized protein PV05_05763 [Exophiala xenobiotica]KIW57172.1 hypothetical protein PV05_05763 [Exophiala xenobiotica]
MKVGDPVYRGSEVHLPVEVLSYILSYVASFHDLKAQSTIWACCLVSRSWYAASVSHLYAHPLLDNRNFDKFARTLCPPISSHKPRVGLENCIKHLDMGGLAYESSKSLTARLIRRTRNSLLSFAAPAVTFSIACLAPLSKCTNLQVLDLSSDSYDMSLRQLLDSIGHLEHLTSLKLPRNALRGRCNLQPKSHWPNRLQSLQISDLLYDEIESWAVLFESWPDTLRTLRIAECKGYGSLHSLDPAILTANTIHCLEIGLSGHDDAFPFRKILKTFPSLTTLAIPAYQAEQMAKWKGLDEYLSNVQTGAYLNDVDHESLLAVLVFTEQFPAASPAPVLTVEVLEKYVQKFPRLRKLKIPQSFAQLHSRNRYEQLNDQLEERAGPDALSSSGLFFC